VFMAAQAKHTRMPLSGDFITEIRAGERGVAFAVKDLFDTAGVLTTYGSAVFSEHVPSVTAEVVARLKAAGYANVGKTNLHEFAYGVTSDNEHFGRVPVAIRAGFCSIAQGATAWA
jgi:Asp-tRNA(Asn)/Glu-tRNA(Gln) amidotransferase A subunit family amidase